MTYPRIQIRRSITDQYYCTIVSRNSRDLYTSDMTYHDKTRAIRLAKIIGLPIDDCTKDKRQSSERVKTNHATAPNPQTISPGVPISLH